MHELLIHVLTRSYGVTIVRMLAPTFTEEVVAERARGGGGGAHRMIFCLYQEFLPVFGFANHLAGGGECGVHA